MSRIEHDEEFLDTDETRILFDNASKGRFHNSIKPRLTQYYFDRKKKPWYRKSEALALREGKEVRNADIAIKGIFESWTKHLDSLGYRSETKDTAIEVTTFPEDAIKVFDLPTDQQVVKRERMSFADGSPICVWSTYYPMDLVGDLLDKMKAGNGDSPVEHIRKKHKLVVEATRDYVTAREATFDEVNRFQLKREETVIVLRRASYTKERKLVFFSDMVLLAKWFVIDYEREVDIWSN